MTIVQVVDHNFEARYLYGNIRKQKGIINLHLNVRSLRFKINEIKILIKEHNPHLIGVSEAELSRDSVHEDNLKIPGYNLLLVYTWFCPHFSLCEENI